MDPRISFSNDFVDSQNTMNKPENIYREAPVSSDFEFSVKDYSMRSADEIIFQGMLVPVKENNRKTTLKEELLVDDDDGDYVDIFARPARNSGWWKERLGLKKPNSLHRKCKSGEIVLETVAEEGNHNIFAFDKKENQESLFGGLKLNMHRECDVMMQKDVQIQNPETVIGI